MGGGWEWEELEEEAEFSEDWLLAPDAAPLGTPERWL